MTTPKKYQNNNGGSLGHAEKEAAKLNAALDPFSSDKKGIGKIPFYSTGARALIRIGGKPVGVCTDIRWTVSYNVTPINTIDTPHAWDVDVGFANINASLSSIVDPTGGPEAYGMFANMASAVHQPMVEMQVLDKLGTSLFFARGVFNQVSGNVSRGTVSTFNAQFTGVAYQHYVAQSFKPYAFTGLLSNGLNKIKKLAGTFTGGLL